MKFSIFELIWIIDILNVKGFEFLDTTFGFNTLFWTVIFVISVIVGLIDGAEERRDRECNMCKLHRSEIETLRTELDYCESKIKELYNENAEYRKEINDLKNNSDVFRLRKQLQMYEDRHQYDLRKRDEAEQKLREYEENTPITLKINGETIASGTIPAKRKEEKDDNVLIDL